MDRVSICEGYYLFSTHWHASGRTERCHQQGRTIDVQLHRMRFRPSPLLSLENASEDATEVYMGLVDRYHGEDAEHMSGCRAVTGKVNDGYCYKCRRKRADRAAQAAWLQEPERHA